MNYAIQSKATGEFFRAVLPDGSLAWTPFEILAWRYEFESVALVFSMLHLPSASVKITLLK